VSDSGVLEQILVSGWAFDLHCDFNPGWHQVFRKRWQMRYLFMC